MDTILSLLVDGFSVALQPECILAMVVGTVLGTIFGALPGLSATTGMALLLPIAYQLDLNVGLLLLAGIYCGALYGGSISAILLGIPGTAAALPTTFDGFPLRQIRPWQRSALIWSVRIFLRRSVQRLCADVPYPGGGQGRD